MKDNLIFTQKVAALKKEPEELQKAYKDGLRFLHKERYIRIIPNRHNRSTGVYNTTYYDNVIITLDKLGVDYVTGNDTPKKGQSTNYIELTHKGRMQINGYVKKLNEAKKRDITFKLLEKIK